MYCRLDGINNKAYDTLKAFNSDPDLFAILISRKYVHLLPFDLLMYCGYGCVFSGVKGCP